MSTLDLIEIVKNIFVRMMKLFHRPKKALLFILSTCFATIVFFLYYTTVNVLLGLRQAYITNILQRVHYNSNCNHDYVHILQDLNKLKQIPSNLTWSKVPQNHTQKCIGPFKHSCIGQCREKKIVFKEGTEEYGNLFVKPDFDSIANMESLVKYIDLFHRIRDTISKNGDVSITSNATKIIASKAYSSHCSITFVGDSSSSDMVPGFIRSLIEIGYDLQGCDGNLGGTNPKYFDHVRFDGICFSLLRS